MSGAARLKLRPASGRCGIRGYVKVAEARARAQISQTPPQSCVGAGTRLADVDKVDRVTVWPVAVAAVAAAGAGPVADAKEDPTLGGCGSGVRVVRRVSHASLLSSSSSSGVESCNGLRLSSRLLSSISE